MMATPGGPSRWRVYLAVGVLLLITVTAVAGLTGLWALAAFPVGLLFGFFLQKGDLCGSSAFSEVLVMRDGRKLLGLWVLIVVAMAGFAVLDLLHVVKLSPKPFLYLSYLTGGVIFGVGMVLAGGCISGCMYKAATGNFNSIMGLIGISTGVMIVEYGPLKGLNDRLAEKVLKTGAGGVVSLPNVSGMPFWALAALFGVLTIVAVPLFRRRRKTSAFIASSTPPWLEGVMTRPWKPWVAGVAIGLLMIPAYLSSAATGRNYPLGVTHGVMQAQLLLIENDLSHVYGTPISNPGTTPASPPGTSTPKPSGKKIVWWLVLLVIGTMAGSWASARMSGQAKLLPKPPDEMLVALFGGVLVGVGAGFATGCVVGNIMSGWALMSVGKFEFGIVTILANWAATYFYLMGGKLWNSGGAS